MIVPVLMVLLLTSPPSRGAWIEIRMLWLLNLPSCVAPLAGGVD